MMSEEITYPEKLTFSKECWEFLNQPQRMLLIIFLKKY